MEETVQRLAEARLRSYSPIVLTWQRRGEIRERLQSEMRSLLSRTTDQRFARQLMTRFPMEGVTDPSVYLDAIVRLPDESLVLTGIRFRGGDPDKPFVDVVALETSRKLGSGRSSTQSTQDGPTSRPWVCGCPFRRPMRCRAPASERVRASIVE